MIRTHSAAALGLLLALAATAGAQDTPAANPTDAQAAYAALVQQALGRGAPRAERQRAYADHAHLDLKVAVGDGVRLDWPDLTIERLEYSGGFLIRSHDTALSHGLRAANRNAAARGLAGAEMIEVRGNQMVRLRGKGLHDAKLAKAALAAAWGRATVGTPAQRARAGALWGRPATGGDRLRAAVLDGVASLELEVVRPSWHRYLRGSVHGAYAEDHRRALRDSRGAPARKLDKTPAREVLRFAAGRGSERLVECRELGQGGKTIRLRRRVGGPPAFVAPLTRALGMSSLEAPPHTATGERGLTEQLEQALEKAVERPAE